MTTPRQDVVLGHADECDGIEEYDNRLPNWWLALFVLSSVLGGVYGIHYHFVADTSQAKQYDAQMAAAAEQWPAPSADEAMASATAPAALEKGKATYNTLCVACHAADGTGGIGPNLTDSEWVHGGSLAAINTTVTEGVPAKGMPPWGAQLGAAKVAEVAAYVHSLGGGQ